MVGDPTMNINQLHIGMIVYDEHTPVVIVKRDDRWLALYLYETHYKLQACSPCRLRPPTPEECIELSRILLNASEAHTKPVAGKASQNPRRQQKRSKRACWLSY